MPERHLFWLPSPCSSFRALAAEVTTPALADALPDRYGVAALLAAGAGLRIGEALGLGVGSVDFLRRELKVTRQLDQDGRFVEAKSDESMRTIPLGDVVLEALSVHIASFDPGPEGVILTTSWGNPVRRSKWGDAWRAAMVTSGLSYRVHDLRHFYASALIDGGYSVVAVQRVLGHASARITLDIYGHCWPDPNDVPRTAIDAVLRNWRSCPSGVPGPESVGKVAGREA